MTILIQKPPFTFNSKLLKLCREISPFLPLFVSVTVKILSTGSRGEVFSSLSVTVSHKVEPGKSQGRNMEKKIEQRPWRQPIFWFAPHYLLSLVSYTTKDHQPWDSTEYSGLVSPTSIKYPIKCP